MTVEDLVCERLVADSTLAALVGTRIYQVILPERPTLPAVRVQVIDEPSTYHLRGEHDITRARVQVDAFAGESSDDPKATADAVADAVHGALSGNQFASAGSPMALKVVGAFRDSRRVTYEAEELRLVRVMQDYMISSKRM